MNFFDFNVDDILLGSNKEFSFNREVIDLD
jgi:hypothetical protein